MKVTLKVYDICKYNPESEVIARPEYEIKGFKIVSGGTEAEEIESMTDRSGIDECHEYLVLELENGETSTFRNSHVDMFRK